MTSVTGPTKPPGVLAVEHVPLDTLLPDPANPRRIAEAELEALTRSMQEFGFVDPILARPPITRWSAGTGGSSPPDASA